MEPRLMVGRPLTTRPPLPYRPLWILGVMTAYGEVMANVCDRVCARERGSDRDGAKSDPT